MKRQQVDSYFSLKLELNFIESILQFHVLDRKVTNDKSIESSKVILKKHEIGFDSLLPPKYCLNDCLA